MSGLVEFTHYQAEALLICLAASLVWASALLFGARGLERAGSIASAEKLWTAALLFAVLPSLVAPTLAAFGVSLRPAPEAVDIEAVQLVAMAAAPAPQSTMAAAPSLLTTEQLIGGGALLYVYGAILSFFLWAARQASLHYAIARAESATDARLLRHIEDWAARLGVRMPAIKHSRHVSSVCITGNYRQTVLIPHGIELRVSTDDIVLMCAHELAHVRRGDTRLFTATQLARVLFWFNPLVARIAAHAELAAEESADALVLQKGVDRRTYAACFVEGLKFAAHKATIHPACAPSFTPQDRRGRRRRLNAILSPDPARKAPLATRLMLSAAASTVALIAVGQAALAVDPDSAAGRRNVLRDLPLIGDITLGFGERGRETGGAEGPAHNGLDIKAPRGAKVFAPGDGVVVEATDLYQGSPAWGKVVVIDHGHGLVTRYAHLDTYQVRTGDRVKTGDIIAAVGATGKVTGPHLHFETLRDGVAIDPAAVIAAAPDAPDTLEPAPAHVPAPAPQAPIAPKAEAAMRFSYRLAPAPEIAGAPGVREFSAPEKFPAFKLIAPTDAESFDFTGPTGFAFDDAAAAVRLAEDLEMRLLGALGGENSGSSNLAFRNGDGIYRFSSDEPMSAEERAELREASKEMREARDEARKDAAKHRGDWRRDMARIKAEARRDAQRDADRQFKMTAEELAEIRREAQLNRREAMEMQREALKDARADLGEDVESDIEDALADLEDAESDFDNAEMSREEIDAVRADLREQRRDLEQSVGVHKRAIEEARRGIDAQIEQIDRMIESFDAEDAVD